MKKLTFVKITKEAEEKVKLFKELMLKYVKELDDHKSRHTPKEFLLKWIDGIIEMQGENGRYLELCYYGENLIGFLYGKIDKAHHKGFIKVGYGYIMEFFVLPEYRLKGYGKEMFLRLENLFKSEGAKQMYLTADPITGKPFWEALGFISTGEFSPENKLKIYEKKIQL